MGGFFTGLVGGVGKAYRGSIDRDLEQEKANREKEIIILESAAKDPNLDPTAKQAIFEKLLGLSQQKGKKHGLLGKMMGGKGGDKKSQPMSEAIPGGGQTGQAPPTAKPQPKPPQVQAAGQQTSAQPQPPSLFKFRTHQEQVDEQIKDTIAMQRAQFEEGQKEKTQALNDALDTIAKGRGLKGKEDLSPEDRQRYTEDFELPKGSAPKLKTIPGAQPEKDSNGRWFKRTYDEQGREGPPEFVGEPKQGAGKTGWINDPKSSTGFSMVQIQNGKVVGEPTRDLLPPSGYLPHMHSGFATVTDENGRIIQVPTTTTSQAVVPGAKGGKVAAPKAGKVEQPKPPKLSSSGTSQAPPKTDETLPAGGRVIGHKPIDRKEVGKVYDPAMTADFRLGQMIQLEKAAKGGDQQAMLAILANHIGLTLGLQKGARITKAFYEEAEARAPWLQRAAAQFDSRGYLSGVKLSPEQIDSMIEQAKNVRENAWSGSNRKAEAEGLDKFAPKTDPKLPPLQSDIPPNPY